MKKHFEDLEQGAVFWGDECEVDKEEMLQYALKNDPLPFHTDEEAAKTSVWRSYRERGIHRHALVSLLYPALCRNGVPRWL